MKKMLAFYSSAGAFTECSIWILLIEVQNVHLYSVFQFRSQLFQFHAPFSPVINLQKIKNILPKPIFQ